MQTSPARPIVRHDDLHDLRALVGPEDCRRIGTLTVRVVDGVACDPMTSGPAADQCREHVWTVARGPQLEGWGDLDGPSYTVRGAAVPEATLRRLAAQTGLMLPD